MSLAVRDLSCSAARNPRHPESPLSAAGPASHPRSDYPVLGVAGARRDIAGGVHSLLAYSHIVDTPAYCDSVLCVPRSGTHVGKSDSTIWVEPTTAVQTLAF